VQKITWPGIAIGLLTGLALSLAGAAAASSLNVAVVQFHYTVNGQDRTPAGSVFTNGGVNVPDGLFYQGTNYVPIRMAANLLGAGIAYESATQTVAITEATPSASSGASGAAPSGSTGGVTAPGGSAQQGAIYLESVAQPSGDDVLTTNGSTTSEVGGKWFVRNAAGFVPTISGATYKQAVSLLSGDCPTTPTKVSFHLGGTYRSIEFIIGVDDNFAWVPTGIQVLGDGKLLADESLMESGTERPALIGVSGVQDLQFVLTGYGHCVGQQAVVDIADPTLTR